MSEITWGEAMAVAADPDATAEELAEALSGAGTVRLAERVAEHPDSSPESVGRALALLARELQARGAPTMAAKVGLDDELNRVRDDAALRVTQLRDAIATENHRHLSSTAWLRAALRRGVRRILGGVKRQSIPVGVGEVKLRTSKRAAKIEVTPEAWAALARMDTMQGYVEVKRAINKAKATADLVPAFDFNGEARTVVRSNVANLTLTEDLPAGASEAKVAGGGSNPMPPWHHVIDGEAVHTLGWVDDERTVLGIERGPYATKHKAGAHVYEAEPAPEGVTWEPQEESTKAKLVFADGTELSLDTETEHPEEGDDHGE